MTSSAQRFPILRRSLEGCLGSPLEASDREKLRHCMAVEVVGVQIREKSFWFLLGKGDALTIKVVVSYMTLPSKANVFSLRFIDE